MSKGKKAETSTELVIADLVSPQKKLFDNTIQSVVANTEGVIQFEKSQQQLEQFWPVLTSFAEDLSAKVNSDKPDHEVADALFSKIYKSFDLHGSGDERKKKQKKVHIVTKQIKKESLEKAVDFAANNAGQFSSRYLFCCLELLSQLTLAGKGFDLMELELVDKVILKNLQKSSSTTNAQLFHAHAIQWLMILINQCKEFVQLCARRAHWEREQEARRKQQEKEQKRPKIGASRHQEKEVEDIDPEEAMFNENKDEVAEDGQIDDTFDENAHDNISKFKKRLWSPALFAAVTQVAASSIERLPKEQALNLDGLILGLVNNAVWESIQTSPAQDRFEQTVDQWYTAGIEKVISPLLTLEQLSAYGNITEIYLFLFNQLLNNPRIVDKSIPILQQVTKMLIETNDDYIFPACAYAIAKACCKSQRVAQQVLKSNGEEVARACIKACKRRAERSRVLALVPAYSALNCVLQELTAEQILALDRDKETNLVEMVMQDVKSQGLNNWDLRYAAMVSLKVIAAKLHNTADAAPLYRRLLTAKILQTIQENLAQGRAPQPKDPRKESEKDRRNRERQDFIYRQYIMPSSIAALNSVFHNTKRNNDPENIEIMKGLVEQDAKFQEMLQFLAYIESKKHEQLISAKTIGGVIAFFLLFLIALPFVFSAIKSARGTPE